MKATTLTFLISLGAATLLPFAASATEHEANVVCSKERARVGIEPEDIVFRESGYLELGDRTLVRVNLARGLHTIVIAGCDDGFEVGAAVLDDDRNLLIEGPGGHAFAFEFDAEFEGRHYIAIHMERATRNGAHWAIQICR